MAGRRRRRRDAAPELKEDLLGMASDGGGLADFVTGGSKIDKDYYINQ